MILRIFLLDLPSMLLGVYIFPRKKRKKGDDMTTSIKAKLNIGID